MARENPPTEQALSAKTRGLPQAVGKHGEVKRTKKPISTKVPARPKRKKARQQNLWCRSGSGNLPSE